MGSGVSLDVTQAPIPNLPLVSCCHPTPSLAQAGCKYISNLHHSCSVMTRAIKKKIEYMNPSESANLSLPPHSALGLRFLGLPPPTSFLGNVMKEGGVAQAMYKYSVS